ncbi:DNA replication and repair protein RecO [Desulfocapsa sulfexigens DSM 10523]|uniref:DNA repair protein RecO n=1 Tax=Desulfocapsa sulfexigens (strain DSM 10523 / SB164P1) TaxID=1167006 RepID=M1NB47_DESSD|nr:DNA repair protein RecO [Desulfocapsa sulfexigens]AGF77019.1 DNA replication and repair protein RecO [Desulfocapsa sulfexigens DSM 10523]
MQPKQQAESAAIVLDCRDHGESDLIVTFFCQHHGRVTGIAKGAKRSKKRFVNKLELFSSLRILHTTPQNNRLAFIAGAELLDGFINLREDISCYATASIIREITLLATKEVEGDEELYPLLMWVFSSLNNERPPIPALVFFLIRFFSIIGYSPQLKSCLGCGKQLQSDETYQFHIASGGICCSKCNSSEHSSRHTLSQGTLRSLTTALNQPLGRLHRLQLSGNSQQEALSFLHSYGRQLFQREIISWAFLENL